MLARPGERGAAAEEGTLTGAEFEEAAALFAAQWAAQLPRQPQWAWVSRRQRVTGADQGYLSLTLLLPTPPALGAGCDSDSRPPGGHAARAPPAAARTPAASPTDACALTSGDEGKGGAAGEEGAEGEEVVLPPGALGSSQPPPCWLELHVARHPSYAVPVLAVKAMRADGAPLHLAALHAALPDLSRYRGSGVPDWAFLSPLDHPVDGTPAYLLHPCGTPAFMALLMAEQGRDGGGGGSSSGGGDGSERLSVYMRAWWSVVAPVVGAPVLPPPAR